MEVVREAIESLRSCFRPHDSHHHTLDTLEQVSNVGIRFLCYNQ